MSGERQGAQRQTTSAPAAGHTLQRQCACGQHTSGGGECEACKQRRLAGSLQRSSLAISSPDDRFEQEAERAAATVTGGNAIPPLTLSAPPVVQASGGDGGLSVAPPIVHEVLGSPGQPLDAATRAFMEPRFGRDLADVRVHIDGRAAESARAVQARAYTVGRDVVFGAGQHAPGTSTGRRLLAHELAHVVQQGRAGQAPGETHEAEARQVANDAVAGSTDLEIKQYSSIGLARAPGVPYSTPYSEELTQELMRELLEARRKAPSATRSATANEVKSGVAPGTQFWNPGREARRTFAVAAVYDAEGKRLGLITRFFDEELSGGLHAEEQIVAAIRDMTARGEKVAYTVMIVDQDPCVKRCIPLLKEFVADPATGTFRTTTPKSTWQSDPSRETSAKTGYKRAVAADETMSSIRLDPKNPVAGEPFVKYRAETSRVRLPIVNEPPNNILPSSQTRLPRSGQTSGATGLETASTALEKRVAGELAKLGAKDAGEVASRSFTKMLIGQAEQRSASHLVPVIGAAFSIPDMLKGFDDIVHGNIVMGATTIGVASIEALSHFLHLTDELTVGGGTILAFTIQAWTTTMQLSMETARISKRSQELSDYIRKHNGGLPPDKELMSYYGLNDEGIMLLKNDIWKAGQAPRMPAGKVRDQVRKLIQDVEHKSSDIKLSAEQAEQLRVEREGLAQLLTYFTERAAVEEQQAKQEQQQADRQRQQAALAKARAAQQTPPPAAAPLLPVPDRVTPPTPTTAQADPFNLSGRPDQVGPIDQARKSADIAEALKAEFIGKADRLKNSNPSSEQLANHRAEVEQWIAALRMAFNAWKARGSPEWEPVKRLEYLVYWVDQPEGRTSLLR